jgi:steroid 5-alpha reductase family enzyme
MDRHFLLTSLIIIGISQIPGFLLSLFNVSHKLADASYSLPFAFTALATLALQNTYYLRQIAVTTMVVLWSLRLSFYLVYRSFYMRDSRLEEIMRTGKGVFSFYSYQALLAWLTCLPVTLLNSFSHNVMPGLRDMIGYAIWGSGFLMESLADWQQFNYLQKNKGKFCNIGLWKYSRHPNFFGEILQWWGIFLSASPALTGWTWFPAILGPLSITLSILFVSGIPPLEQKYNRKFMSDPIYQRYKKNVPLLIPSIPREPFIEVCEKVKKTQ